MNKIKAKTSLIAASLTLALAASLSASADTNTGFTAERVFDLEYATDPQISPDGSTIVYVRQSMNRRTDRIQGTLWQINTETGAHTPLIATSAPASAPRWSPDGTRLLYATSMNGKPVLQVRYMESGNTLSLAALPHRPRQASWSPDGQNVAFTMFTAEPTPQFATPPAKPKGADWSPPVRVFDDLTFRFDGAGYLEEGGDHIFVVPASGGTPRQVTDGPADFSGPQWLDADTLLATANEAEDRALDLIESEIYSIELTDMARAALTDRDGPDAMPTPSPDGNLIAYTGFDDEILSWQQNRLYLMNADGTGKREIETGHDREISALTWSPDGESLIAQVPNAGEIDLVRIALDGSHETLLSSLGGTSIGRPYASGSFSISGQKRPTIAFTAGFTDRPSEVAMARGRNLDVSVLTALNDDLIPHLDMALLEEIKVTSSHDSREIEAWVARPPGFEADGSYPLILEIHGGPFAMYGPFFSAEIQRYAAEGYVTVYVNPRGSTGYGEEFAQLIDQNYPGEDYNDLMDVVDALVARDYVSPDRLFVTGGSGGGILTAWIVTKTNRFAAAASIKPVINWMTMALTSDIAPLVTRHWIRADPWKDIETFMERSPIAYVEAVETPTLLMVGEADYRTPAWEAEQFYSALKQRNIDTALIRVPESPHLIAGRPSRIISKTDNIMGWFSKYDTASEPVN